MHSYRNFPQDVFLYYFYTGSIEHNGKEFFLNSTNFMLFQDFLSASFALASAYWDDSFFPCVCVCVCAKRVNFRIKRCKRCNSKKYVNEN